MTSKVALIGVGGFGIRTAQVKAAIPWRKTGGASATEIVAELLRNTAEDKIQAAVQYLL